MIRHTVRHHRNVVPAKMIFLLLLVVGLVAAVFIVWKLFRLYESSLFLSRLWRTNIVLSTKPVVVVSLPRQADEHPIILTIPTDAYVSVPYGYGSYRLEGVWRLGELEKRPELFAETVANVAGIRIAAWINTGSDTEISTESPEELYANLKNEFGLTWALSTGFSTNLNLIDKLLMVKDLHFTRPDQWVFLLAHKRDDIFRPTELPGPTEVRVVERELLSDFIGGQFEDGEVRQSGLRIEVRNTTTTPRVGQSFARILLNFGAKVITVTNEAKPVSGCLVQMEETIRKQKLIIYLVREFGCLVETTHVTGADVVIFVGDEFAKRWSMTAGY